MFRASLVMAVPLLRLAVGQKYKTQLVKAFFPKLAVIILADLFLFDPWPHWSLILCVSSSRCFHSPGKLQRPLQPRNLLAAGSLARSRSSSDNGKQISSPEKGRLWLFRKRKAMGKIVYGFLWVSGVFEGCRWVSKVFLWFSLVFSGFLRVCRVFLWFSVGFNGFSMACLCMFLVQHLYIDLLDSLGTRSL